MTEQECLVFIAGGRQVLGSVNLSLSDGFAQEDIPIPIEGEWQDGWITRMARRFGGTVHDKEGPPYGWDWGQALCRAQYGLDWSKLDIPDGPDEESVRIAQAWEDGEWPAWAVIPSAREAER